MEDSLLHTWERFLQVSGEQLTTAQNYLRALLRGSADSTQREFALSQMQSLGDRLRGLGFSEASRYAERVGEWLGQESPQPEAGAPWLQWLRQELARQSQQTHLENFSPVGQLWLCARLTAYGDAMVLAARRQGLRVLTFTPQELQRVSGGPEMVIVQQDYTASLSLLEALRERLPQAFLVAILNKIPFEDRVALSLAGADLILTQSVAPEVVLDLLARKRSRGAARGSRVLLVEDDRVTRKVLERYLTQGGYEVRSLEGKGAFGENLQDFQPDFMILDYQLPEGLGTDLCLAVRSDPRWSSIPILFLTASRDPDTVSKVFAAGADDFLAKPVDSVELLGRLRNRLLRSRELRLQGDVHPSSLIPGRHATQQLLTLFTKLARRQQLSASLALLQRRSDSDLMVLAQEVRQNLRRPGDLVGTWDQDTLLIGLYDTRREACRQVLERILEGCPHPLAAAVASCPADGSDNVSLLAPLHECLQTCPDGQVWEVSRERANLHVAILSPETPAISDLTRHLRSLGHRVEVLRDSAGVALRMHQREWSPNRVLLDLSLPKLDPVETLRQLRALDPPPLVVVTHPADEGMALRALELGAAEVLAGEPELDQLRSALHCNR